LRGQNPQCRRAGRHGGRTRHGPRRSLMCAWLSDMSCVRPATRSQVASHVRPERCAFSPLRAEIDHCVCESRCPFMATSDFQPRTRRIPQLSRHAGRTHPQRISLAGWSQRQISRAIWASTVKSPFRARLAKCALEGADHRNILIRGKISITTLAIRSKFKHFKLPGPLPSCAGSTPAQETNENPPCYRLTNLRRTGTVSRFRACLATPPS